MKLDIQEVYLLQQALNAAAIKASDALVVAHTAEKLEKEFKRLEALQPKEEPVVEA